ncbi:DUF1304 domain-containing protein [Aurantiacibacter marinus]|uniref:Membrane protein n=1 Tax=Aurantiacibacter marinus TaxID=874156 RepID=A0A0H0XKQ6_9SPHN|nr:DUF1304 domain-containing protein [Aurantiacibacter marinus]KLI63203.1 membrane protein [Aurantiacibacter marinus]
MKVIARTLIGLIAALHLYIAWFEMFAWETRGPAVFATLPPDLFAPTTAMAANQGLYNAFLAAGLIWSVFVSDPVWQKRVATFFLSCVAVAGIFGAATVSERIALVQTLPAVLAMIFLWLAPKQPARLNKV